MKTFSTTTKWFSGSNKDRDFEAFLGQQSKLGFDLVAFTLENERGLYRFVFSRAESGSKKSDKE